MNLIPYLRTYSAGLWKKTNFYRNFWTPSWHSSAPPPPGVAADITNLYCFVFCFVLFVCLFFGFYGNILSTNGVEGEITPLLCTTSIMLFLRRRHGEAGYAALDVYSKQAECWVCFPCIRPTTAYSNHWNLKRSELCPIVQEYSPHVIVITGNNFIPALSYICSSSDINRRI